MAIEVFAGAALALHENGGGFADRNLADEAQQVSHLGRHADDVVVAGTASHFAAQSLNFGAQAGGFQRVLDGDLKFVEIERLADEIVGAQLEGSFYVLQLRVSRDHDHCASVTGLLNLFQDVDAAGVGQAHVEQHEIRRLVMRYSERSRTVVSFQDAKSPLFALLPKRPTDQLLVVDDENLFRRHCVTLAYYLAER